MKVKALKRHGYGGKRRAQGTVYYIDNAAHVKILVATKTIEIVKESLETSRRVNKEKSVVSETKTESKKNKKAKRKKSSSYSRKDMVAEDNSNTRKTSERRLDAKETNED